MAGSNHRPSIAKRGDSTFNHTVSVTLARAKAPSNVVGGDWQVVVKIGDETITLSQPGARTLRDQLSEAIADAEAHNPKGTVTLDTNLKHLLKRAIQTHGIGLVATEMGVTVEHVERLARGVALDRYYVNKAREFISQRVEVK